LSLAFQTWREKHATLQWWLQRPPVEAIVPLELSSEEIRSQVAEAAYYRALQRGFAPGKELEDWLEAEMQTMARLGRPLERN
jgi:hypothetical protein